LQEVPTEDPFVMSEYAKSVVLGAQANEDLSIQPPKWLVDRSIRGTNAGRNFARSSKTATSSTGTSAIIACCKHAIAYSVEEVDGIPRAKFNAIVSGADLLDSYMPAFQDCFMEGGGRSSMCSYNSVNNVPTCASAFLLNTTIRQRYGRGDDTFIMSDYSAIMDTWASHKYCETAAECIAKTLINGVDQDGGGNDYDILPLLVANSTAGLTEANVRAAATRLFRARVSLGILDPPQSQPWLDLDIPSVLDTEFHRNMSLDAATQGIVLLTNKNSTLPLSFESIRKIAVIGPNADVPNTLYGNYQGTPPFLVTPKMGLITALGDTSRVYYAAGCTDVNCNDTSGFPDAIAAASQKDVDAVVLVLGIDQTIEREGTDRINLTLPGLQINLAQAVCSAAFTRSVPCIIYKWWSN
jgi:xylan 1,4-beta-xylosidase